MVGEPAAGEKALSFFRFLSLGPARSTRVLWGALAYSSFIFWLPLIPNSVLTKRVSKGRLSQKNQLVESNSENLKFMF